MNKTFSEKKFGGLIQRTLLAGVVLSSFLFLLGFVLKFSGSGPSGEVMRAGALVLILTPAARVAMLVYGFWRLKDSRFALAALAVLGLLFMSVLV